MLPVRSALKTQIPEHSKQSLSSVGNMSNLPRPDHVPEILQGGAQWQESKEPARYVLRRVGTSRFSASDVGRCRVLPVPAYSEEDRSIELSLPYLQVWATGKRWGESGSSAALNNSGPDEPSQPISKAKTALQEDKGLTATSPFKGQPNDSKRDFLLQAQLW